MLSFIIGSLGFSMIGLDFVSSIGVAASSLGNVGPALENLVLLLILVFIYDRKMVGIFLMLLGRLELFTVLILFTPFFWKRI